MTVSLVVEGDSDLPVARKLITDARLEAWLELDCAGKSYLDRHLPSYNNAAKGSPWFVLRDLDNDAPCASAFLKGLNFEVSKWMCFRLAVRELEAWLLADSKGFSRFFEVREDLIPRDPDLERDPTLTIVDLARKSRSSRVRSGMAPARGSCAQVGELYEAMIIEFGTRQWSLARAAQHSESLRRARRALRQLGQAWHRTTSKGARSRSER